MPKNEAQLIAYGQAHPRDEAAYLKVQVSIALWAAGNMRIWKRLNAIYRNAASLS